MERQAVSRSVLQVAFERVVPRYIAKGKTCEIWQTRNCLLGPGQADGSRSLKCARMSKYIPSLPGHRLVGDPRDHSRTDPPAQQHC